MRLIRFTIQNFKGIENTTISLADEIPGNVVTLIGLNESGKTTILEALSHFVSEDKETASLVGTVHQKSGLQDIIPKDKKAAFSGRVSVKAVFELDDADVKGLAEHLKTGSGIKLDVKNVSKTLTVERSYRFEDSAHAETNTYWSTDFPVKRGSERKFSNLEASGDDRKAWISAIGFLREGMPNVVYFPTFLFNFPDRIYLEGMDGSEINTYYKNVIQDVLDSNDERLSVSKHIVERIKKVRDKYKSPGQFIAHLFGQDEKSQIDAVMQAISNQMSRVIFGAWGDILGRPVSNKRVQVDWFVDAEQNNIPYLQFSIIDGRSRYSLSERSLGFRWFFSFLLFTQFRANRSSGSETIFLFDEPASNLHSKAQIKLLDSFAKIASGKTFVVYSTHSHYMVNPMWLEKAYIVQNSANDYDDDDQVDTFSVRKTNIKAIKYRSFVAENPSKTTYFQPVLDALDFSFSPLERSSRALIIEGKFDYHPFVYLRGRFPKTGNVDVFPAGGAGSIGTLISLFRGWGVEFRMLLDDDQGGVEGKKKYSKEYLLTENEVVTLGDVSPNLAGKAFEGIYKADVDAEVVKLLGVSEITKRHYSILFQELVNKKENKEFSETEAEFAPVAKWLQETFQSF